MKGSVYTRARKGGTSIYITYTPPGEPRVRDKLEFVPEGRAYTKRILEASKRAEDVLHKRLAAVVEGRHGLVRPKPSPTVARFTETVYADELRARGLRSAEVEIRRITKGPAGVYFGPIQLAELSEWTVRKYVKMRREAGAGPAIINRDLARISNLWNVAAKRRLVSGLNPIREAGRLKEPRARVRYLTPEEEAQLLAALRPDLRAIAEVALHTGIRRGALLGLRWRHLDLGAGVLDVTEDLDKTGRGYRVAMNSRVRGVLADLRTRGAHTGPDDLIFCRRDGRPYRSLRTAFQHACGRAGVEDFRWHDFRHTAASRIVQAGGTLLDAGEHLGHRTLAMTQRYAHLSPDGKRRTAELTVAPAPNSVTPLSPERNRRPARSA